MSVAVVSCVYGHTFSRFIPRWAEYIQRLDPRPDEVIVASDWPHHIPGAHVIVPPACDWNHPQAYYLNAAIREAETEWVWIVDIDDLAHPDGLRGIDEVEGGVWQMGYVRSDGEVYIPNGRDAWATPGNHLVAGSAIRREHAVFADVAFQDWHLWRRLRRDGLPFEFSGRTHYTYMRHHYTRTENELLPQLRADHYAEMEEAERAVA